MMKCIADFKAAASENGRLQLLELPYSGGEVAMVIILSVPSGRRSEVKQNSLSELEAGLTWKKLSGWLSKLDRSSRDETIVYFPKYTVHQHYDLVGDLKVLGLSSVFDQRSGFSGIDGTTNLMVSGCTHETVVEVNEVSTEAAAITVGGMLITGIQKPKRIPEFNVDHPFMFLIRDRVSGSILFLGRIVDPSK